jgi:hypothetical protein
MARKDNAEVEAVEVDETEEVESTESEAKTPKEKKEPVRGQLDEGYVTPVGLAKVISERKLHTNRDGELVDVAPQMVYSYIKNAPKEDPYPFITVTDSLGHERQAVLVEDGVAWWIRKNERTVSRKTNAAAKAAEKLARAAAKATEETEGSEPEADDEVTEAE